MYGKTMLKGFESTIQLCNSFLFKVLEGLKQELEPQIEESQASQSSQGQEEGGQ